MKLIIITLVLGIIALFGLLHHMDNQLEKVLSGEYLPSIQIEQPIEENESVNEVVQIIIEETIKGLDDFIRESEEIMAKK